MLGADETYLCFKQLRTKTRFISELKLFLKRMFFFLWYLFHVGIKISIDSIEDVVKEVLKFHFDENELLMVLKSLKGRKYFDKIFDDLAPSQ